MDYILPMFRKEGGYLPGGGRIEPLGGFGEKFVQAMVRSCNVTDRYATIKLVVPAFEGQVRVGQTIRVGVMIANSEVGMGKLIAYYFWEVLQCLKYKGRPAPTRVACCAPAGTSERAGPTSQSFLATAATTGTATVACPC